MLYRLSLIAAVTAFICSAPAFAQETQPPAQYFAPGVMGHHASPTGNKKSMMMHHMMGHHACKNGNKKMGHCM